jgi:uncharacterized protein YsxB (DUF464 family)
VIEITATLDRDRVTKVEVQGHGEAEPGFDIVCAAVSAITETALAGMLYHDPHGTTWRLDKGYISIHTDSKDDAAVSAILTTMVLGLKEIEKEYPKRVSLRSIEDTGIADKA